MASEDLDKVRMRCVQVLSSYVMCSILDIYIVCSIALLLTRLLYDTISKHMLQLGFSKEAKVENAVEYDKSKEKGGYVAGKHIDGRIKWWFQRQIMINIVKKFG